MAVSKPLLVLCLVAVAYAGMTPELGVAERKDASTEQILTALRGSIVGTTPREENPFAVDWKNYKPDSTGEILSAEHPAVIMLNDLKQKMEKQALSANIGAVPGFFSDDKYESCADCGRKTPELISEQGYPVEIHEVETADGYILEMHRIPHPPNADTKVKRQPCLIMHGLLDASSTWVMQAGDDSLALRLANEGYDVWLGNSRGNTYSVKHKKYTRKDNEYWQFSFDEMAKYDIPAMVDYVLDVTGYEKLNYAGHSQGTTQIFAALSDPNNTLRHKLNVFSALAPVSYMKHQTSLLLSLIVKLKVAELVNYFGMKEFLPANIMTRLVAEIVCGNVQFICKNVIFALCGMHHGDPSQNIDPARLPVMVAHTPAGTSVQNMLHWAQLIESGKFQAFDYGSKRNQAVYGQETPIVYDMSNIDVPMEWYAGTFDDLGDPADVLHALSVVKREYMARFDNLETYNHMDHVWGRDVGKVLYNDVVAGFKKYGPPTQ